MAGDGALKIENPSLEDTGHYVCSALNAVGSALARSHLIIFDPHDLRNNTIQGQPTNVDLYMEEARLALLESTLENVDAQALGPKAIRVSWEVSGRSPGSDFVDGYRVFHRVRRTDRYAAFKVKSVPKAVSNLVIDGLEEHIEYEIFVQPFHGNLVGLSSPLKVAKTHQARPSQPPLMVEAKMANQTKIKVVWSSVPDVHHNGQLLGYRVSLQPSWSVILEHCEGRVVSTQKEND